MRMYMSMVCEGIRALCMRVYMSMVCEGVYEHSV